MIKLQKVLAGLGLASRRDIELWIKAGRLRVNGQVAPVGLRIVQSDHVQLDEHSLSIADFFDNQETRVFIYNKRLGEECSKKPRMTYPSVFKCFPKEDRWILVGRLDLNTSGLLLVSNNGELANRLMHPSYEVLREYRVRVDGILDGKQVQRCLKGVRIEDYRGYFEYLKPLTKKQGRNHWYAAGLKTGRNREIRRIFDAVGVTVNRLVRVAYGPIRLPRAVQPGQYIFLDAQQVDALMTVVGCET